MNIPENTHSLVREYYGQTLQSSADLKTSACCGVALPDYVSRYLPLILPEVNERFFGCGSPLPPGLRGCRILDLGCGVGRDSYLAAKLAGAQGSVVAVDMTAEQLQAARSCHKAQMAALGADTAPVDFRQGLIEDLRSCGLEGESVDVVISNCVVNLCPDKERVFREIWRVLKPGGELYFADVFADRRLPEEARRDPVLVGECLGGALYVEDFRRLLAQAGFAAWYGVERTVLRVHDPALRAKVEAVNFVSMTARACKLPLEDREEDYGQTARYLGSLAECPQGFVFSGELYLPAGEAVRVSGNQAAVLSGSRWAPHFAVTAPGPHEGLWQPAPPRADPDKNPAASASACCCG
ncbi:MAG: methyltransferase domain-containing protein [Gracilibacteraceae bacterium]|jgi:SAM-dependent methyltransferase|nr:methyltransferase domain-containing protein [Gracilibacteraceae bacterium]